MSDIRSPFPPSYFAQLAEIESTHWWFQARNRILMWTLRQKAGSFHTFLEVGCGTGYVLENIRRNFPNSQLFGAEYFEEGLSFARSRIPSANFRQLDVTSMTEENVYDAIGAFDVIEHIEDDKKSLFNLARALKPTGKLIITVPQHQWLWSVTDEAACHVRRYSSTELVNKLRDVGLKVEYKSSFVSLLMPLMLVSRLGSKKLRVDPMRELKVPRIQNYALATVMRVETYLLKIGLKFPFGGSLLVVASRDEKI